MLSPLRSLRVSKRLLQVVLVCTLAVTMLGANTPHSSFDKLGHQLVCQCGCGQILLECNHVGCPVSGPMIEELKAQMATGLPDAGVLNWFVNKYGPIVLAAPIRGGFDTVAWIVPFAALFFATVGVALLLRRWQRKHAALTPASAAVSGRVFSDHLRERVRRETTSG